MERKKRGVGVVNQNKVTLRKRKDKMKNKIWLGLFVVMISMAFLFSACTPKPPSKDKIRIGRAVSLTGPNALIAKSASILVYDMWIDDVNARGGIYVKEYGKKLPIELIVYDDESDHEKSAQLLIKLIEEDKVDFVFAPCGTTYLFATAPVANKHEYILLGAEGGALKIGEYAAALPYLFAVVNFANTQMPALADLFKENGIKTTAIIYLDDLHGVEYTTTVAREFGQRGITVEMAKSIPLGAKDLSPLLKKAKALDVDAFLALVYPHEGILAVKQAAELGINFKAFHVNTGTNFGWFPNVVGEAAEGILGSGAWNCKSSPGAKEFCNKFIPSYGEDAVDWWGHLFYWVSLQFFEQAIEKAGTLNQEKIRDVMATETFDTALGPTWFENGVLAPECHAGQIGQWQKGVFEVVAPRVKATAPFMIPKPSWPEPKKEPAEQ
jgi:branched-chain amino acid transport system substrate-binding protein